MKVWLLERHSVPIVSCDLAVAVGASSDPIGKAGLAYVTANMLDEGAGTLGAIDMARALDSLGAHLTTDANADASFVSLTVLRRHLPKAFSLFADTALRPRLDGGEFKRVKDLWINELKQRARDPGATARVVGRVALFGTAHAYGHPWDGTVRSAHSVSLDDVRRFYASAWRPGQATLVCAGDVAPGELTTLVQQYFGSWTPGATASQAIVTPPAPRGPWPKLVLVDRPDAPQSVIAVVAPGLSAASPDAGPMWRVNDAIGGGFTSRLNQDLREDHGYTYGASSRYSLSRGVGQVISYASVVTEKTGDALAAMLADLGTFARDGLTQTEMERTRSQARQDLVSTYESVESIARRLAANASVGLAPDADAVRSAACDAADKTELDRLAAQFYNPKDALIVVVGPRVKVSAMLVAAGLPASEPRDEEGNILSK
jgi:predicted Zn-dependent peptidase